MHFSCAFSAPFLELEVPVCRPSWWLIQGGALEGTEKGIHTGPVDGSCSEADNANIPVALLN